MNIETKMLNKMLANQTQQYIKRTIFTTKIGLILGIQSGFDIQKSINIIHPLNRIKKKNHMIISMKAEKAFYQIQHSFMIETFSKLEIERNFLSLIKNIH